MRRLVLLVGVCFFAVVGAAAAAGITGTFTGKTSQGKHVTIRIVDGVVLRTSVIRYVAACTHNRLSGSFSIFGPLHGGHRFKVHNGKYTVAIKGKSSTAHHVLSVRFTIHGKTAHGSFVNKATIKNHGKTVGRCTTGKVSFTATK